MVNQEDNTSPQLPTELIIHQDASFFIGLTKANKSKHTSLIAGALENGMPTLLLRVGKDRHPIRGLTFGTVNNELSASLHGERSYVAYTITLEQYNQLTRLLRLANLMSEKPIHCYQQTLSSTNASKQLHFTLSEIEIARSPTNDIEVALKAKMNRFCIETNNCRHMGIAIVQDILNVKALPGNVSSDYSDNFSFQAQFKEGNPASGVFYVFPLAPYNEIQKIPALIKLYEYLGSLSSNKTKLLVINELYTQIQTYLVSESAEERDTLLRALQSWSTDHSQLFPKPSRPKYSLDFISSWVYFRPPSIHEILDDVIKELTHYLNSRFVY